MTSSPAPTRQEFTVAENAGDTVLAALRKHLPGNLSWSAVRKLLQGRRVTIGGVLCLDEDRRLTIGETVAVAQRPVPPPPTDADVNIRYADHDVLIVEKPSGMVTLRRKSEYAWPLSRRMQQPTLDECVPRLLREHAARRNRSEKIHQRMPRLFSVHRIDRDTSGLLVFARTEDAQQKLIAQFAAHKAVRKYFALVPGTPADQTIETNLVRDRGDGLRGSSANETGQQAITHIRLLRKIGAFSELECSLETGRTNQIRIHLAEIGHPVCGDLKYRGPLSNPNISDDSQAPRLCLHAAELRLQHPSTDEVLHFTTPWPQQMQHYLNRLAVRKDS
ncbi:MAG: RluA family pseudouridine synthase [Planctomycetaceae bacterium]